MPLVMMRLLENDNAIRKEGPLWNPKRPFTRFFPLSAVRSDRKHTWAISLARQNSHPVQSDRVICELLQGRYQSNVKWPRSQPETVSIIS